MLRLTEATLAGSWQLEFGEVPFTVSVSLGRAPGNVAGATCCIGLTSIVRSFLLLPARAAASCVSLPTIAMTQPTLWAPAETENVASAAPLNSFVAVMGM